MRWTLTVNGNSYWGSDVEAQRLRAYGFEFDAANAYGRLRVVGPVTFRSAHDRECYAVVVTIDTLEDFLSLCATLGTVCIVMEGEAYGDFAFFLTPAPPIEELGT
jgi:hypothetical protein